MKKSSNRKITWFTRMGYGMGGMVNGGGLSFASSYLMIFVTTQAGINAALAATLATVGLLFDTVLAPIAGMISDNFYQTKLGRRFGRRRFWILLAIPLTCIQPFMFTQVRLGFWFYLIAYIVYNFAYTMAMVPLNVLPQEMTQNYKERNLMTGTFTIFGFVYGLILGVLESSGFALFGEKSAFAYTAIAIVDTAVIVIALIVAYFSTWEKSYDEVQEEDIPNLVEGIKKLVIDLISCFRIRSNNTVFFMRFFSGCAAKFNSAALLYYTVYAVGLTKAFKGVATVSGKVVMIFITAWFVRQVTKHGFKKGWKLATGGVIISFIGWFSVGMVAPYVSQTTAMILYFSVYMFWDFMTSGLFLIPQQIANFLPDIDELVTNRRREGIYSAVQRVADQGARALMTMAFGFILTASGFITSSSGDVTQPPTVRLAILFSLLGIGVVCTLISIFASRNLHVNEENMAIVNDEIKRVHDGGSMDEADPEVKKTCELLSGVPYAKCFGNNTIGYKEPEKYIHN